MAFFRQIAYFIIKKLNLIRGKIHQNDRSGGLYRAWGYIFSNHIEGDYVEFGVYKGESAVSAIESYSEFYNWLQLQQHDNESWRRELSKSSPLNKKPFFHLLDTFEGMPKNDEKNFIFHEKSFLSSHEKVLDRIRKVNFKNFFLYKSKFKESEKEILKNFKDRKISIANIDCDIYSSTVDSFKIIENFLQIGSVILLDDYNAFNADNLKGQRKALQEYKEKTKWIIEPFFSYMYSGQSFLVVGNKDL